MNIPHNENPFKGLNCYEENDNMIFYGRSVETQSVYSFIMNNTITVLLSKAGLGKTSLIKAGLNPMLRNNNFFPIMIRLNFTSAEMLKDQIINSIQQELSNHSISEIKKNYNRTQSRTIEEYISITDYFQQIELYNSAGDQLTLVLIFDQFEEFFSVGKNNQNRTSLWKEISDYANKKIATNFNVQNTNDLNNRVRIVLSLREEYLTDLNTLEPRIFFFQSIFRLLSFTGNQARDIINIYPKFNEKKVQDEILNQFCPEEKKQEKEIPYGQIEVEPFLLSLLCYQMVEKGISSLSNQQKNEILANFYDEELRKIPNSEKFTEFIETRLLTENCYRTPFYIDKDFELRHSVEVAINRKILKNFFVKEREHVEIIHDLLIPIIKKRKDRKQEILRQKKLVDELNQKQIELIKKKRLNFILIIAGILVLTLAIVANLQYKKAESNRLTAIKNKLATESILILPKDNMKAFCIAEEAYNIQPLYNSPTLLHAISTIAYSTYEHPFYSAIMKHKERVSSIIFSPDSTKILTASIDGSIKLWDLRGNLLTQMKHNSSINNTVFSPESNKILTASDDKTAKMWDLKGTIIANFKHNAKVTIALFSPNGDKVLTVSKDKIAKLWDLEGNIEADLNRHTAQISNAFFSPDGSKILTISWDNTIKLWDLKGRLLADLNKHKDFITTAIFSPDGTKIGSSSWDKTAKVWNLDGTLLVNLNHTDYIWSIEFSPDGNNILTASSDQTAKLWNISGKLLKEMVHNDKVWNATFSPQGNRLLTRLGKSVKIWSTNGTVIANMIHEYKIKDAFFCAYGNKIVTNTGQSVKLWDLNGKNLINLKEDKNDVSRVIVTKNGKNIFTCSENTIKLWELDKRYVLDLCKLHESYNNALFSPSGDKILTCHGNSAKLWDLNGKLLAELKGHTAIIMTVAFSQDGKKIVTGSWDNSMKLWDLDGNPLTDKQLETQVVDISFSNDGNKILTVTYDYKVSLWDLKGNLIVNLNKNNEKVTSARLSPNGLQILFKTENNIAKLVDTGGNIIANFTHIDKVLLTRFSPDGKMIFTASNNKIGYLWNLQGKQLTKFDKHTDLITDAIFAKDNQRILTTSHDGTAKMWNLKGNLLADLDLNKHTDNIFSAVFTVDDNQIITISNDSAIKQWFTPGAVIEWLKTAPIPKHTKEEIEILGIKGY